MIHKNTFFRLFWYLLFIVMVALSCEKDDDPSVLDEEEVIESIQKEEILFIGNSHTYFNEGVYTHLKRFVTHADLNVELTTFDSARGGFTLQDHLADAGTLARINERSWDAIVLQENTFVAAQELQETFDAMNELASMVKPRGAKVYLFMTWPYKDQPEMLAPLKRVYAKGILETGGILIPVGEDWMTIQSNDEVPLDLYAPDGFHPSLQGTYYAAAKFYQVMYGQSPSENPYEGTLDPEVSSYLKKQAD